MGDDLLSVMQQERERAVEQKEMDNRFWMGVFMDLGDQEHGRFELFQNALRVGMSTQLAGAHWNFPGAGESLEQMLDNQEWRSVQCGHKPPQSMGYIRGSWQGKGGSWCAEEEHWRACGQPFEPDKHATHDGEPDYGELCLRHPGDKPRDDGLDGQDEYEDLFERFAPLTTKASELVYAIHICGAAGQPRAVLRSAYQMQLQLRVDPARRLLAYDAYEFVPDVMFKDWPGPTERDVREIERDAAKDPFGFGDPYSDSASDSSSEDGDGDDMGDEPLADVPADEHNNWFIRRLWMKFQKSRVYRLRFSLDTIIGIRLLKCVKRCSCLLVLELSAPPPRGSFAVRTVNNRKQMGANEWEVIDDWTPQNAASVASRHYISAGGAELQELANYLATVCPRIKRLLTSTEERAKCPNTLLGDGADARLPPSAAPSFANESDGSAACVSGGGSAKAVEDEATVLKRRMDAVHAALRSVGVKNPDDCSSCVKQAILDGHIDISSWQRFANLQALSFAQVLSVKLGSTSPACGLPSELVRMIVGTLFQQRPSKRVRLRAGLQNPLHQVLVRDNCPHCGKSKTCRVRDVIEQPDKGKYYCAGASYRCGDDCGGIYVTRICLGTPTFDSGKFHNHCTRCPGFGVCIFDYRNAHCGTCGHHYFAGTRGFKCERCQGKALDAGGGRPPPATWDVGVPGVPIVTMTDAETAMLAGSMSTMESDPAAVRGLLASMLGEQGLAHFLQIRAEEGGALAQSDDDVMLRVFQGLAQGLIADPGRYLSSDSESDSEPDQALDHAHSTGGSEPMQRQELVHGTASFEAPAGSFHLGSSNSASAAASASQSRTRRTQAMRVGKKRK